MRRKIKWSTTPILLIVLVLTMFGAALAQQSDDNELLRVRVQNDLSTMDPAHVGQSTDHAIALMIYSGLVRYEAGGLGVVPDLATDWEISDDALVYTFNIREGVQWHKGYGEVTAEDVVYSIERIKDPATASRFQQDLDIIESVEALDRYTVQFTLSAPFSDFIPGILAFRPGWIVNEQAVEERGDRYGVDPIGSGPYVFENWSRGNEIVLVKNEDYYQELDIERVSFRVINDDSVAELAVRTGELDVAYIFEGEPGMRMLQFAESNPNVNATPIPGYRTQWTTFNTSREAVSDERVRQAIIHAINKEAAVGAVYGELGQVVSSIFNPNIPGFINPDPFPYDPERARSLLEEAGYGDGLEIDVLVMPSRGWPDLATVLQDMWRQVGIDANLIIRERAVYDELTRGGDFDVLAQNITRAAPSQYAAFLHGPNIPFPNTHHYTGADELIDQANLETNDEERAEIWEAFQERVLEEDVVGFAMSNVGYVLAWREGVEGVATMYQDAYPIFQMSIE